MSLMPTEEFITLKEMGFDNLSDIKSFITRHENDVDVLKVYLHRHQGEWMARSKKFKFKRTHTSVLATEGSIVPYRASSKSSDFLLRAVAELEKLGKIEPQVAKAQTAKDKKKVLLQELEHLEKVVTGKVEDIRRQIDAL